MIPKKLGFSLLAMSVPSLAVAGSLPVQWDCYLPESVLDCSEMGQRLYSGALSQPSGDVPAVARVEVRAQEEFQGVERLLRYEIRVFQPPDAPAPVVIQRERISSELPEANTAQRLLDRVTVSLAPLLSVVSVEATPEGEFQFVMKMPGTSTDDANKDPTKIQRWYFSPSLSTYFNVSSANVDVSGSGRLYFNWSHPKWRFRGQASGNFEYERVTYGDIDDTYQSQGVNVWLSGVRSVHPHWALAVMPNVWTAQGIENTDLGIAVDVGMEYAAYHFDVADADGNVFVSYKVGPRYLDLELPNLAEKERFWYGAHTLSVGVDWHFKAVDLDTSVYASASVAEPTFSEVFASVNLEFRVTQAISISPYASMGFTNADITQPAEVVGGTLDDLKASSAWARLSTNGGLSIAMAFGNAQLNASDRRW